MRYEKKNEPLAPRHIFYKRIARNLLWVGIILAIMLLIGTTGYHYATNPFSDWIDAFHNASMILSGMGPVITEGFTTGGKIFSSLYALFSGIVFVGSIFYALMPAVHRIFHRLHLEEK
jgi:nucleoside recognition membrane protein YjiH